MKYIIYIVSLICIMSVLSFASVPSQINYQGVLKDSTGKLVSNTALKMVFSIYADATTTSWLWTEKQSVTVESGVYNVRLGSSTALTATIFDGTTKYLGVKVGSDSEMAPRAALVSVPYAFKASYADILDNSITTDKIEDQAVTSSKLSSNSVSEEKIQNFAVTTNKLHPAINIKTIGHITADAFYGDGSGLTNVSVVPTIPDFSITTTKLATNSVTSAKLATDSVTSGKILNSSVTADKLDVAAIDSNGKLPALTSTYVADLDGSTLLNVDASKLNGQLASHYLSAGANILTSEKFGLRITTTSDEATATAIHGTADDSSAATNFGVYGLAAGTSGSGLYGVASGAQGRGVEGFASNSGTEIKYGGHFSALGGNGVGVYGVVSGAAACGGSFNSTGVGGVGIRGYASNSTGAVNYGIIGLSSSPIGYGIYGNAAASDGIAIGVRGGTSSLAGYGVYAKAAGNDGVAAYIESVLQLKPIDSPPSPASKGMIYVNNTDHHLYYHNGTAWVQLDNNP